MADIQDIRDYTREGRYKDKRFYVDLKGNGQTGKWFVHEIRVEGLPPYRDRSGDACDSLEDAIRQGFDSARQLIDG